MKIQAGPLVIGVDGGGTKTEAVLAVVHGDRKLPEIIATETTGPSNLQRLPLASSLQQVALACSALLDRLPVPRARIAAACFAMAGSGNPQLKADFQRWLDAQSWLERAQITHDARAVIAAGTSGDAGIALVAGTGSLAFGLTADGHPSRCGGWGGLVGDEGGAYWMALQGFRRALRAVDRRGPATCLVDDLRDWCGGSEPALWPHQLSLLDRDRIAAAAKVVTAAANKGDAVAGKITGLAAQHLATMVATLAQQEFSERAFELALTGGLLCHCPLMSELLAARLEQLRVIPASICLVPHPSHGAARIAASLAVR